MSPSSTAAIKNSVDEPAVNEPAVAQHTLDEAIIPQPAAIKTAIDEPTTEPAAEEYEAAAIEADDAGVLDSDSAFGGGSDAGSSTQSLHSGIFKYRHENGRTYHAFKEGEYVLPNDEREQDRLDLLNHVFLLVNNGKLYTAPIKNPARVLDVGTGTGIWAIDFADQHPESHVIGNDLSPIQPIYVPPNLEFEVDDVSAEWLHKPFNFIHIRMLGGSLLSYKNMLAAAFENMAPGGYCEAVEFETWARDQREDPSGYEHFPELKCAPMFQQWQADLNQAGEKIGRRMNVAVHLREWMIEVGFVNVVETVTMVPYAPWARDKRQKEIGMYMQPAMIEGTIAYGGALFTRVLGWSNDEYMILGAGCSAELRNPTFQLYSNLRVVYGQKPMPAGAASAQT